MYVLVHFIFVPIMLIVGQHNSQAQPDVINNCINSTNSTSCSLTYEQVYINLSKSENNFNISKALYPGRSKASSLHVLVNVYGPNKTKDSIPAQYTWSVSCLYAAAPPTVLEVLSLGSILVSHRTKHLNLHIPLFCCNISESREEREEKIKGFLTRVLGELQDLAVSPGIRDPTLNTAKCITHGHESSMDAAGLSIRIGVLWLSLGFVLVSSPLLSKYVAGMEKEAWERNSNHGNDQEAIKKKTCAVKALFIFCYVFSVIGSVIVITALVLSICHSKENKASFDILIILGIIIGYSCILPCILKCYDNSIPKGKRRSYFCLPIVVISATVISYHFCWLIIGIMLNPTWGLTVALLVSVILVSFVYSVYLYLYTVEDKDNCTDKVHPCLFFTAGFLAVLFLVVIIVFAGQSYNSSETADDVLKTSLLYFPFVSWISWKKQASHSSSTGAVGEVNQNNPSSAANGQQSPAVNKPDTSALGSDQGDDLEMENLLTRPHKK